MKVGKYTYKEGDLIIWGEKKYRDKVTSVESLLRLSDYLHIGIMGKRPNGTLGWDYIGANSIRDRIRDGTLQKDLPSIRTFLERLINRYGTSIFPSNAEKWSSPFLPFKPIIIDGEEYI